MKAGETARYHFGEFELDARRRELSRDGVVLDLGARTSDLLFELVRHAGRDVTREELMDRVWPDVHVTEGNLTQHVSILRRALGDDTRQPRFIVTVPRRGYRFVSPVEELAAETPGPVAPAGGSPEPPRPPRRVAWTLITLLALALSGAALGPVLIRGDRSSGTAQRGSGAAALPPAADASRAQDSAAPAPTEAETAYLRGRYHLEGRDVEGYRRAGDWFARALELEPDHAPAMAGLAAVLTFTDEDPSVGEHHARRALEIDPLLASAHATLGFNLFVRQWRFDEAEKSLEHALELAPDDSQTSHWLAFLRAAQGDTRAAVLRMEGALASDPLSPILQTDLGQLLYFDRRYAEAEQQLLGALDLDPEFGPAYWRLGEVYLRLGRYRPALVALRRARELVGPHVDPSLAAARALAGEAESSEEIVEPEAARPGARVFAWMAEGKTTAALEWFLDACAERNARLTFVEVDPAFDPLRAVAGYDRLVRCVREPTSTAPG